MFFALILLFFAAVTSFGGLMMLWRRRTTDTALIHAQRQELAALKATLPASYPVGEAGAVKTRFLANVSHELRTPVAGIIGLADLLGATPMTGEQGAYVAAIRSSGHTLGQLVDEILDFSRIESGRLELRSGHVEIALLVEGVAELLAPQAEAKSLEIACLIGAEVPKSLLGDAGRIRQILLNLAGNAVKFTQAGGVGIKVNADAGVLCFDVHDTGPGVPADRHTAIFHEFEQGWGATPDRHSGTGLGLAIARRLATAMGGNVDLLQTSAQGSIFRLTLPMLYCDTKNRPEIPVGPIQRAIVVARASFTRTYLSSQLAALGFAADWEVDCAQALETLRTGPAPDVVIVDCACGSEVVTALVHCARLAGVEKRVILFSPRERRQFGEALAGSDVNWLVKPVRRQSLEAVFAFEHPPMTQAKPPSDVPYLQFTDVTVLLAENNEINALVAIRQLERLGARVTHVKDGLSALALARRAILGENGSYALILMDLRLPGMDGLEVTREIRQLEASHAKMPCRIVALTANGHADDRHNCIIAGFDDFYAKPIEFSQLGRLLASGVPATASVSRAG